MFGLPQGMDGELFQHLDTFDLRSLRLANAHFRKASISCLTQLTVSTLGTYDETFLSSLQKSLEHLTALKTLDLHTKPQHGLVPLPQSPKVLKSITLHVDQRPSSADWDVVSSYCRPPGLSRLTVKVILAHGYGLPPQIESPYLDWHSLKKMCSPSLSVRLEWDWFCTMNHNAWGTDHNAIANWISLDEILGTVSCHHFIAFSPLVLNLPAFTRLRSLELVPFSESHPLHLVASLTGLTCLKFRWNGTGRLPLADISTLQGLQVLHVSGPILGDEGLGFSDMEAISHLRGLREQGVNVDIGTPEFGHLLGTMACLTSLVRTQSDWHVHIIGGALRAAPLPELQCLEANFYPRDRDDAASLVSSMPSISCFDIGVHAPYVREVIRSLWNSSQLTKLVLSAATNDRPISFAFLSKLTQLEQLRLCVDTVDERKRRSARMRIVGRLTRLTRLKLACGDWSHRDVPPIPWEVAHPQSALRRLRFFATTWAWRLDDQALDRLNAGLLEMGLPALRVMQNDKRWGVHYE